MPQPASFSLATPSTPPVRILLIGTSPTTSCALVLFLAGEGFEVACSFDRHHGETHFREVGCDLVMLDVMLPDIDALHVCRTIRRVSRVPIVMLSARSTEEDVVKALDCGADDHVRKPFGSRELLARIRRCLSRAQGSAARAHVFQVASL